MKSPAELKLKLLIPNTCASLNLLRVPPRFSETDATRGTQPQREFEELRREFEELSFKQLENNNSIEGSKETTK